MTHDAAAQNNLGALLRRSIGVLLTVAFVTIFLSLHDLGVEIPNPPAVLILGVVFAAFSGGLVPGLISAALSWAYIAYHFSIDGSPFRYTQENLIRVAIWGVTMPATAVLVGILHRQAMLAVTRDAARRAAASIRREEKNTRMIVDQAMDAVVSVDPQGQISGWNPQAHRVFGWTTPEALGRSFVDTVFPDRLRTATRQSLASLSLPPDSGPHRRFETEAVHRDGSEFPIEVSWCTLHTDEGDGACAFIRDISERRQAERRQQLMVRELDHRVKNNLAVVLSIVDQTASRASTVQSFVNHLRGRIMAMARLHGSLAASRWSGADLQTLVRQTLEPYLSNSEGRVVVRGAGVLIPPHAVSSVCMALHELATNASKFGALSVPEGRVAIEWAREDGADGVPRLRLRWEESGGPAVEQPTTYGLGRRLIEEGVTYEAAGSATLEFSPSGVTCELVIPLAALPAAAAPPGK